MNSLACKEMYLYAGVYNNKQISMYLHMVGDTCEAVRSREVPF